MENQKNKKFLSPNKILILKVRSSYKHSINKKPPFLKETIILVAF